MCVWVSGCLRRHASPLTAKELGTTRRGCVGRQRPPVPMARPQNPKRRLQRSRRKSERKSATLMHIKTGLHMIASVLAVDHHLPIGGGGAFGVSAKPEKWC